ncbi:hypothetical protein R6Z02_16675 [Carnobacterium maltaromaticum]|uniref:hypothetical protein n=1 Tax=Carnobacterium maltaromaticum TaxID=2751 RepID=UPI00298A5223|nr:hypothetical protein [Carnobacterium maltaromaticum]MDW5525371.1 hypothetical protein [Carnobacterium maltaromaticum]
MLTNEQRAHDIALLATDVYISLNQNKCARDLQLAQISPSLIETLDLESYAESFDVYDIYKNSYDKALLACNRDFI